MTQHEIKMIRLARQYLTQPSDRFTVLHGLCGIQAQFLSNARHALRIRCTDALPDDAWGEGLVKSWTLRGTMHIFAEDDLPLFLYGAPHSLRPQDTLEEDPHITAERKRYFAQEILRLIREGVCEREALKRICLARGMTEEESASVFDQWGGTIRALAESGAICYRVQEKKSFMLCKPFVPMSPECAERELVRRYFTHYAPATVRDAAYLLGMTQTKIRGFLQSLPIEELEAGGRRFLWIDRHESNFAEIPSCILLAGFDPLLLGYDKRDSLFLPPEYLRGIFNLSGIVFPAILLRGKVVGKWKREREKILITPFQSLDGKDCAIILDTVLRLFGEQIKVIWQEA